MTSGDAAPEPEVSRFALERFGRGKRSIAAALVILVCMLIILPAFVGRSMLHDLFFVFTMLTLAQFWNLLAGYAGLVSIGQQAYVGVGAYALYAVVIVAGLDPLIGIPVAGLAAGFLAMTLGLVIFRLAGAYFAIGTWVIAEICRLVLAQVKILGGGTGTSLPPEAMGTIVGTAWIAEIFGVRAGAARDILAYWLALALLIFCVGLIYTLLNSRHGLALSAIRDSEMAAQSVGVDARKTKMAVYLIAAVGAGMTGALIYLQTARISPDAAFSVIDWTAYVLLIVVIGGIGTIEGPVIGVIVLYLLRDQLSGFGTWYLMILGGLAIAVMLLAPAGLWGLLARRFDVSLFPIRRRLVDPSAKLR